MPGKERKRVKSGFSRTTDIPHGWQGGYPLHAVGSRLYIPLALKELRSHLRLSSFSSRNIEILKSSAYSRKQGRERVITCSSECTRRQPANRSWSGLRELLMWLVGGIIRCCNWFRLQVCRAKGLEWVCIPIRWQAYQWAKGPLYFWSQNATIQFQFEWQQR